jgi:hypothetical protein
LWSTVDEFLLVEQFRCSKVGDLDPHILRKQDTVQIDVAVSSVSLVRKMDGKASLLGFEISVNDSFLVHETDSREDLSCIVSSRSKVERAVL